MRPLDDFDFNRLEETLDADLTIARLTDRPHRGRHAMDLVYGADIKWAKVCT